MSAVSKLGCNLFERLYMYTVIYVVNNRRTLNQKEKKKLNKVLSFGVHFKRHKN